MNVKKVVLSALIIGLGVVSCKKEGCLDADATNFSAEAKKDDGSCTFEGSNVFWYNEAIADFLIADDAVSLTYYVDDILIGSSAAGVFWTSAPDCGQDASITITKNLGNVKTQSYTYKVIDQTGFVYWNGTLNFNANTCFKIELN